jgi:hypothetical protein
VIVQWIGGGAFSNVWLVRYAQMEQNRAIKIVDLPGYDEKDFERLTSEAKIMASLPRHRNRVVLDDGFTDGTNLMLITEFVTGGTVQPKSAWVLEEVRYALRRKPGNDCNPPEVLLVAVTAAALVKTSEDLKHLPVNETPGHVILRGLENNDVRVL